MEKYVVDGQGFNVAPENLEAFLKMYPTATKAASDQVELDIPGGKRMLGESEWECCTRECNEETGFRILDIKEDVDNIKTTFSIDLMKMYVIRK